MSDSRAFERSISPHWWIAAVALLLWCPGCATTPEAETEEEVTQEPAVFYPPPPDEPRIQFLTSFNDARPFAGEDKRSGFSSFILGEEREAEQTGATLKPYGAAMYDGAIYVCDSLLGYVHVYDLKRRMYSKLGLEGQGNLRKPINITIADDGTEYVSDVSRSQIVVFDAEHRYLRAIGNKEECRPTDCVVRGDDLYLVDVKDHEIEHRNAVTGALIDTFGGPGSGPGELFKPTNIAADADGTLYVTDTVNSRVQIFDSAGRLSDVFGTAGDRPGDFARPKGIAVGPDGLIYVADAAFENVQVFGPDTQLYTYFGKGGNGPGELLLPAGVTISTDGVPYFQKYVAPDFVAEYLIIVVSQYGGRRISVYAKGHARGAEQ